jgi:hypothetical protein
VSRRAAAAGAAVLALALGGAVGAGCGDDGGGGATSTAGFITGVTTPDYLRTSTGPYETTVEGTATFIKTDKDGSPIPLTSGSTETDAGDEEGIRVPADFEVTDGKVSPSTITVPPTLPVAIRLTSKDGNEHHVSFETSPSFSLKVPKTGSVSKEIEGQQAGQISARIDGGAPVVVLNVADDAGP